MDRLAVLLVALALVAPSPGMDLLDLSENPLGPADTAEIMALDPDVVADQEVTADGVDVADLMNAEDEATAIQLRCSSGQKYVRDPWTCNRFAQCANGIAYDLKCPKGLFFDLVSFVCDYPQNVACRALRDRTIRRRIGRFSGPGNDRESSVSCPQGYVPINCEASSPRFSDGTFVRGRSCSAFNSGKNNLPRGQRAIATCARVYDDEILFVRSGGFERRPVARCPSKYRIIGCFLRNAWAQAVYAFGAVKVGRDTCQADIECTAGRGCYTQAVCRLRNGPFSKA